MVSVRKNAFYKKAIIPDTGVAKLTALFKDFPTYETTNLTLEGGANANRYVVSGSIPDTPKYKQGKLKSGKLMVYTTATELSESARVPQASLYKIKKGIPSTEGKASMLTNGNKLFVMSSMCGTDNMYAEESFDGAEKTLGTEGISEGGNGGVMLREKPYADAGALAKVVYVGGTYSIFHMDGDGPNGGTGAFLRFYFGMQENGTEKGDMSSRVIFLKPINRNKISGRWTVKNDHRTGLNQYTVFAPEWKWNDVKGLLSFIKSTPVSESDDATTPATKSNTIFQTIRSSPDNQTALSENLDGEPWAFSTVELSQENADVGGQSLKLAHFWNQTDGTKLSQDVFGPTTSINPQFACASGDILPYPVALDQAFASDGTTIQDVSGATVSSPEVNVKFNITELGQSLRLAAAGGMHYEFDKYANNANASATAPSYSSWAEVAPGTTGTSTNTYTTLLRSFTVTFGNYPVVGGESLDSYLKRGMEGFYWGNDLTVDASNYTGVAANPHDPATTYKKKGVLPVVGGFTVMRYMDADDSDSPRRVVATPLLTRVSSYGYTANISERAMLTRFVSGAGATLTNADANIMMFGASTKTDSASNAANRIIDDYSSASVQLEPSVALSMDQFVNAKVVFNMNGTNSRENCDLARVYFTDGVYSEAEDSNITTEPPSMQMYFPLSMAGLSTPPTAPEGSITDWSWTTIPEFWPRYMTVWLQNYSYFDGVSGSANIDTRWGRFDTGNPTFGAVIRNEFPVASGARLATAYVDSINLKNFTPEVTNHSANASSFTKPMNIRSEGIPMYLTSGAVIDNGATALPRYVRGWASNTDNAGEEVARAFVPTYVTIGMDNLEDALYTVDVSSAGAVSEGTLLWNGFSTPAFSGLENVNNYTAKTWVMGVSGSLASSAPTGYRSANMLGNQMAGNTYANPTGTAATAVSRFALPSRLTSGNIDASEDLAGGTYADPYTLYFASGNNGIDTRSFNAFTSKGTMQLRMDTGTDNQLDTGAGNARNWVKRENVLASTKIKAIPEFDIDSPNYDLNNRSIRVQNPEVFREDTVGDTSYVIYCANASLTDHQITGSEQCITQAGIFGDEGQPVALCVMNGTTTVTCPSNSFIEVGMTVADIVQTALNSQIAENTTVVAVNTPGAVTSMTLSVAAKASTTATLKFAGRVTRSGYLTQQGRPQNEIITFNEDVTAIVNNANLPYLYVSPVKKWLNMEVYPGSGNATTNKAWESGSAGSNVTYDSILGLGEAPTAATLTGSTYNESDYGYSTTTGLATGKNAVYRNPWVLDTAEKTETNLDLEEDFGFGTYDASKDEGGQVDVKALQVGYQTEFDITAVLKKTKDPEEPILFTLQLNTPTNRQSATLTGNDSGNSEFFKPYYLFEYIDPVPQLKNLKVTPAFDGISKEADLYKLGTENLNAVVYEWEESGDDIWYKYILRKDNATIPDKYSSCFFHAPLNEPDTITAPGTPSTYYAYTYDTNTFVDGTNKADLTATGVKATIEGLAGYAAQFNGTTASVSIPNSEFVGPVGKTEYSIVVHAIPASGMTGKNVLLSKGTEAAGLVIYASGSTAYNQKIYATINSATALLTGTSNIVCDGQTPLNVIYTYKQTTEGRPNMELYVNGRLENYSINNTAVTATANLTMGALSGNTSAWDGTIEEVLMYDQQLCVVESGSKYLHSTIMENEYEGGSSTANLATKNARVFAFDYTNIRGTSSEEVGMSNETSWEMTPL